MTRDRTPGKQSRTQRNGLREHIGRRWDVGEHWARVGLGYTVQSSRSLNLKKGVTFVESWLPTDPHLHIYRQSYLRTPQSIHPSIVTSYIRCDRGSQRSHRSSLLTGDTIDVILCRISDRKEGTE